MRLGLVGRGPQAHRYLVPKNGGNHIVAQIEGRCSDAAYAEFLSQVDGVIVATHPAGHKRLCMDAIALERHVFVEKPLALNLDDCEAIIDAAEHVGIRLFVAHLDLWTWGESVWPTEVQAVARISCANHDRDYSPWLDWGPHALAILARLMPSATPIELNRRVQIEPSFVNFLQVTGKGFSYTRPRKDWPTPMWLAVLDFMNERPCDYNFQRRVYRALFAQENHGTT